MANYFWYTIRDGVNGKTGGILALGMRTFGRSAEVLGPRQNPNLIGQEVLIDGRWYTISRVRRGVGDRGNPLDMG